MHILSQRIYHQHLCRRLNEPDLSICGPLYVCMCECVCVCLGVCVSDDTWWWFWTAEMSLWTGQRGSCTSLSWTYTHTYAHTQAHILTEAYKQQWNPEGPTPSGPSHSETLIKDLLFQEVGYMVSGSYCKPHFTDHHHMLTDHIFLSGIYILINFIFLLTV